MHLFIELACYWSEIAKHIKGFIHLKKTAHFNKFWLAIEFCPVISNIVMK